MKCKCKLSHSVSSTDQKQVLRPRRTPRKPGTVSTQAVASGNISLCVPCPWGCRELGWGRDRLPWPHLTQQIGPSSPQGHVPPSRDMCLMLHELSVPTGLQTASPAQPVALLPHWGEKGRDGHAEALIIWVGSSVSCSGVC